MLYAILIHDSEAVVNSWSKEEDDACVAKHVAVQHALPQGVLGPVVRLRSTAEAVTLRPGGESMILDGPYAETKEALLGLYVVDCETLDEAVETARRLPNQSGKAVLEVRPVSWYNPGSGLPAVT
jgi:hypothetical protein